MSKTPTGSPATGRGATRKPTQDNNKAGAEGTAAARRREVFGRVHPWVSLLFRLLLAAVLGVAGALKVGDPLAASRAVRAYQLLPGETLVQLVGYGLPFLELALAVLLLLGLTTRFAGIATGLLMLVFIVGIASVWARGISIDCGCFGGGGTTGAGDTNYLLDILRDVGLVVAAAWLTVFPSGRFALDGVLFGAGGDEAR